MLYKIFLEINTIPGMTKQSIIPQQFDAANKSLKKIISFFNDNLNRNIPVVSLFYKTNNPKIINNENSYLFILIW